MEKSRCATQLNERIPNARLRTKPIRLGHSAFAFLDRRAWRGVVCAKPNGLTKTTARELPRAMTGPPKKTPDGPGR